MDPLLLQRYAGSVPRYTSYPTAPHFHDGVGEATYREWLVAVPSDSKVSLYLHVPFCRQMCWYCGCHTKVVRRDEPVRDYAAALRKEVALVAGAMRGSVMVTSVHWGGGTPTLLTPRDFVSIMEEIRRCFDLAEMAEVAVEIDPRTMDEETAVMLGAGGVNRASLGVQDFNRSVQEAINRVQSFETTKSAVDQLRRIGVKGVNLDLMYGLPHQDVACFLDTVEKAVQLQPDRLALFGYAHVPWMKKHQRLIDEAALPDPLLRAHQFGAAADRLGELGFTRIGLDHFARPEDSLAVALRCGALRRNFQGYTTDGAETLIGLGASAIGSLREGYVQNDVPIGRYVETMKTGRLGTVRGIRLGTDDYLRRAVIERLMCDGEVDLGAVRYDFGLLGADFAEELEALKPMEADGLVRLEGERVRVTRDGSPFVRVVAATFDRYLAQGSARHSQAV